MKGYRLPKKLILGAALPARESERLAHWREDTDLMAAMGLGSAMITLSWRLIEPKAGVFDAGAVRQYREALTYLKASGIRPLLVMHAFDDPDWFSRRGGFYYPANAKTFLRYVGYAVKNFGDLVSDYVTLSEPNIKAFEQYGGTLPATSRSNPLSVRRAMSVMAGCHIRAYEKIHRMRSGMGLNDTRVGVSLGMKAFAPLHASSVMETGSTRISRFLFQDAPARACANGDFAFPLENLGGFKRGSYADFIGISYHTRSRVTKTGDNLTRPEDPKTDDGYEIYPKGLLEVMHEMTKTAALPLWITENSAADGGDYFRSLYLYDQLAVIAGSDLPVERYYYGALLDEPDGGETLRRGLVAVDPETKRRTVKKSGHFYREIIRSHGVTEEMAERYITGENYHR